MKWIAVVARLLLAASMVVLAHQPNEAGAAGVYENATAEPAFLRLGAEKDGADRKSVV